MKKNKVVYTCILGGYDEVLAHTYVDADWDYILFTDNENLIKEGFIFHWQVRRHCFNERDATRNSRYEKINPHIVFPKYEYSLYVDGNLCIENGKVFQRINELIQSKNILSIPLHPERKCIYEEAKIIIKDCIDYKNIVNNQMNLLKKEQYPKNNGLYENCLLFRQHNKKRLQNAQDLWWKMLLKYSKRDQLSALYSFWKYNIKPIAFFEENIKHRDCEALSFKRGVKHTQHLLKAKFSRNQIKLLTCWIPIKKYRYALRRHLQSILA